MKSRQLYRLRPFSLAILTLGILAILSLFDNSLVINKFALRQLDIFADIRPDTTFYQDVMRKEVTIDSLNIDKKTADSLHINLDSLLLAEQSDLRISDFRKDSLPLLGKFFASVEKSYQKKGKTRIAYFGDSMIEGDLITQTLRNLLQQYFGGKGVGFVPIYSKTSGFRQTIINKYNESWRMYSFLNKYIVRKNFGPSGFVFSPLMNKQLSDSGRCSKPGWVEFNAPKNSFYSLHDFEIVDFYYGKGSTKNKIYVKADTQKRAYVLDGSRSVNKINLNAGKNIHKLRVQFDADTLLDAFGFSFESEFGIFVDNYSVRANSGLPLNMVPKSILSDFNTYLDYDLIILQYGLNVSMPYTKDYGWYEKGMINVINHLKACFPNADILVVSVGDRGFKKGNKMETMPSIPILVECQRRIAQKTNSAFWDLYQTMGGRNSMVQWVDSITPLANKDYTHVNHLGAEKIGTLLFNNLMNEYKIYKSKH